MLVCKVSGENITLAVKLLMKQDLISLARIQLNKPDIINKANAGFLTVAEVASALGILGLSKRRLSPMLNHNSSVSKLIERRNH